MRWRTGRGDRDPSGSASWADGQRDADRRRESRGRGRVGGIVTSLCAAVTVGVLVISGCAGADPDRHGAGEKLTEVGERDPGADRSGDGGGGDGSANGADLVGQRLPDVGLSWLVPPESAGGSWVDGSNGVDGAQGDPTTLRDLTGEPTVINIWAVWCTPCRDEIPHFQRLWEQAGDQVRVLGVDHDDNADAALEMLDELNVDYPQLADPDAKLRPPFRLGIGIPVTVYVDADGRIAHVARTPYRSLEQLRADTERYLDVSL